MPYVRSRVYQNDDLRALQRFLDPIWSSGRPLRVLDAGCGYELPVDVPRAVHLVGMDASADALRKNENIDEAIVGDITTFAFQAEEFDAVLCWTVLEHLDAPASAVANLSHALKPGGLLIVGVPNLWSLKGLITKLTPHRFHVWVYRRLFGYRWAGRPGYGPYRTFLRRDIAPRKLERLASRFGLEPVYTSTYRTKPKLPSVLRFTWSALGLLGRVGSLGRWDPEASEHIAVFRKRAHAMNGGATERATPG